MEKTPKEILEKLSETKKFLQENNAEYVIMYNDGQSLHVAGTFKNGIASLELFLNGLVSYAEQLSGNITAQKAEETEEKKLE